MDDARKVHFPVKQALTSNSKVGHDF